MPGGDFPVLLVAKMGVCFKRASGARLSASNFHPKLYRIPGNHPVFHGSFTMLSLSSHQLPPPPPATAIHPESKGLILSNSGVSNNHHGSTA
jgi:hypothetical protein